MKVPAELPELPEEPELSEELSSAVVSVRFVASEIYWVLDALIAEACDCQTVN